MARRICCLQAYLVFFAIAQVYSQAWAAEITWELTNPVRLFEYIEGSKTPSELWNIYRPRGRSLQERYKSVADHSIESPFNASVRGPWQEREGNRLVQRYGKKYYQNRSSYEIKASLNGVPQGSQCSWQVNGDAAKQASCQDAVLRLGKNHATIRVTSTDGSSAEKPIEIKRRIIIGIGDSYASGEGNPDVPAKWRRPRAGERVNVNFWFDDLLEQSAQWWDTTCHRSFWTYQVQTVLRLADADPQSDWVAGIYSCSGAEVFDGLLYPQAAPPGIPADCGKPGSNPALCTAPQNQLNAVVQDLCDGTIQTISVPPEFLSRAKFHPKPGEESPSRMRKVQLKTCSKPLPIDSLLLSIGGNDIGFGGIIAWAVAPVTGTYRILWDELFPRSPIITGIRKKEAVCPSEEERSFGECDPITAQERLYKLTSSDGHNHYDALVWAFDRLGVDKRKVVINAYPNPLYQSNGTTLCQNKAGRSSWRANRKTNFETEQAAWDAFGYVTYKGMRDRGFAFIHQAATRLGARNTLEWDFNVLDSEAERIDRKVIGPLNDAVSQAASKHGWQLVNGHLPLLQKHGWCSFAKGENGNSLRLPAWRGAVRPAPIPMTSWYAYASRGRWIRTANDSVATQWTDSKVRSDGISSTFHPTAEAHAAIADSAFEKVHLDNR